MLRDGKKKGETALFLDKCLTDNNPMTDGQGCENGSIWKRISSFLLMICSNFHLFVSGYHPKIGIGFDTCL